MKYNEVLHALQNLTKTNISQTKIAEALNYSVQTVNKRAVRNSNFTDEEISTLEDFFNIKLSNLSTLEENSDDIIADYYYDVFGSCGGGAFVLSENKKPVRVPRDCFSSYSQFKTYSVINAIGDSMLPYIQDKDRLIVEHWDGEQIRDNRVYIFSYNGLFYCYGGYVLEF